MCIVDYTTLLAYFKIIIIIKLLDLDQQDTLIIK